MAVPNYIIILINQTLLKTKRKIIKKKRINSAIFQFKKMSILNYQRICSQTQYFNFFLCISLTIDIFLSLFNFINTVN